MGRSNQMLPVGLLLPIKCYEVFLYKDPINIGSTENILNIYKSHNDDVNLVILFDSDVFTSSVISNFNYGFLTLDQAEQLYDDYKVMDENQLILSNGRDPFDLKRKILIKDKPEIDLIDLIQKLLEEN